MTGAWMGGCPDAGARPARPAGPREQHRVLLTSGQPHRGQVAREMQEGPTPRRDRVLGACLRRAEHADTWLRAAGSSALRPQPGPQSGPAAALTAGSDATDSGRVRSPAGHVAWRYQQHGRCVRGRGRTALLSGPTANQELQTERNQRSQTRVPCGERTQGSKHVTVRLTR